MTIYKTQDLDGALLDCAVAECGEWETAHEHFPTMTLDPRFKGWRLVTFENGDQHCILEPANPFRQDPQAFSPSTDWTLAGPIIERGNISIWRDKYAHLVGAPNWLAGMSIWAEDKAMAYGSTMTGAWTESEGFITGESTAAGPTYLIAAMRCYVRSKLGDTVELP